jgi:glycosyltransferase involved in cell wall biosynthesis
MFLVVVERERRLAVVSDAVHPFNHGGKETRLRELTTRLPALGWEPHIYTMHWWPGPRDFRDGSVTMHAISPLYPLYSGGRRSIWQAVAFSLCCFRLIAVPFDVVEVDQIPFLPLLVVRIVSWIRRKPMVATWHEVWGPAYWRAYLGPLGVVGSAVERLAVRLPDRIIAASTGTASRLDSVLRRDADVTIAASGVDLAAVGAAPADPAQFDFLFVGRLLRHKNMHVVLEALNILRKQGHQFNLRVIGTGPEETRLRAQALGYGLSHAVRFDGRVDQHASVLGAMKSAGVFVFPSVREGFGVAPLEAMACGTPVVTSDHPDNHAREHVINGYNGLVCAPVADALAEAMMAALSGRQSLTLGAKEFAGRHSWDRVAALVAAVYNA